MAGVAREATAYGFEKKAFLSTATSIARTVIPPIASMLAADKGLALAAKSKGNVGKLSRQFMDFMQKRPSAAVGWGLGSSMLIEPLIKAPVDFTMDLIDPSTRAEVPESEKGISPTRGISNFVRSAVNPMVASEATQLGLSHLAKNKNTVGRFATSMQQKLKNPILNLLWSMGSGMLIDPIVSKPTNFIADAIHTPAKENA